MIVALGQSMIRTMYLFDYKWQVGLTDMGTLRVIRKVTESMEVFDVGVLCSVHVQRVISATSRIWKS